MPRLAEQAAEAYLQTEHLPYEQRFPEVCRLLLEGYKAADSPYIRH
jgi:hypothetical protein